MRRSRRCLSRVGWFPESMIVLGTLCLVSCQEASQQGSVPKSVASASTAQAGEPQPQKRRVVFRSPLAGTWYQEDGASLSSELDRYVEKASGEGLSNVCALISPHAGYTWSGQTAAYGFRQLQETPFGRVVVIGPSHRVPLQNLASVPDSTHYATPLGEIALDQAFLAELKKHSVFQTVPRAHDGEHSVQIQLPLLQHVASDFQLVPIVVGQLDRETTRNIAQILCGLIDQQTLVIASSDFTHFGQNFRYFPFRDNVPDNLKKLDMGAWALIEKQDTEGFYEYIDETGATICGRCAIGVLLDMLPADAEAHLLHYDTSGNINGDHGSSVSYLSIAFTGRWSDGPPVEAESHELELSDANKNTLLELARAALAYALEHRDIPTAEQLGIEVPASLKKPSGVFVTLNKDGQLRGCIGEMIPTRPLYRAVMVQAIQAGLNDTRFPPVSATELPELDLEISVLSPLRPIESADQIVLGKHGIQLDKDGRRSVFLPQVPGAQQWNLEETLNALSRKAGLAPDAWKQNASFRVFEATVFGEEEEVQEP